MREKNLVLVAICLSIVMPSLAFAECHEDGGSNLVPQQLVNQTDQITQLVGDKPSPDQIKLLNERVVDLRNAAEAQKEQAAAAQMNLDSDGDCGIGLTQAQCIQKKIDQDQARLEIMDPKSKGAIDTQDEIQELQVRLNAPHTLNEASLNYSQASGDLQEMIKTNDFSYQEHLGIIGKALLSSWKELITPGPIVAISAGMAGYGIARTTPLNADAKSEWQHNPAPGISKVTDQIGYAYPVMLPFLIVGAVTKNNETMKTFDALAVGTAMSQAIVEPLKYAVHEERPNGSDNLGFPSGHAAESFMMATVLDHEYPGHHHLVGLASYAGAALVSFYRVREENHSPGEIFAGAGIGIATGIAASRAVDDAYNDAEGEKQAYWKDAVKGDFRIPHTHRVVHCVPGGLAVGCAMVW